MKLLVILAIFAAFGVNEAFSRRWRKYTFKTSKTGKVSETCWSGDGSSYRGVVSKAANGKRCLNWNKFFNPWGSSEGVGDHSYCRNPDHSPMPWCRVRRGRRTVRQFCDIPKCVTSTTKPPPVVLDTEMTCGERPEQRMHKIVNGFFTRIESHPWVAAIFNQNFLCGASLISPCWVVTAAHCFEDGNKTDIHQLSVFLGKKAINETHNDVEQSFTVDELIIHEHFDVDNFNNDIALLKIRSRDGGCVVKSASARIVCLPPHRTQLLSGFQCTVAGYGQERYLGGYSQYLKKTEVKLISQAVCRSKSYYGDLITNNMLCAGSPDWSTDACKGDSGGPMVCELSGRMFLFGIVSWGERCAEKNKPGVYTQVTNYNKWMAAKTGLPMYTQGVMYPTK